MTGEALDGRHLQRWVTGFAELLVEVRAGRRPARHLRPFVCPGVQQVVHGEVDARPDTRVQRVLVQVSSDRAFAVVVLQAPQRTTALALTIQRDARGLVVTDLGSPGVGVEHAPPPPANPVALAPIAWGVERPDGPMPRWQVPSGWRQPVTSPARAA